MVGPMSDQAQALDFRIIRRAAKAGIEVAPALASALGRYLNLLAHWNTRINLTALLVNKPNTEAIDRLLVEPLAASRHLATGARVLIDLGSGGGSPAIPLRLSRPELRLVMVEAKVRKCAFLREAVRELKLAGAEVLNRRFEEVLAPPEPEASADVVTLRAVRLDESVLRVAQRLITPRGEVWLFRGQGSAVGATPSHTSLRVAAVHPLVRSLGSELVVLRQATS